MIYLNEPCKLQGQKGSLDLNMNQMNQSTILHLELYSLW